MRGLVERLDDKVLAAVQRVQVVGQAVQDQYVAGLQPLARRRRPHDLLASPDAEHSQVQRRAEPALRERSANQGRSRLDARGEEVLLQRVRAGQCAAARVTGRGAIRQQAPPAECHEQHAGRENRRSDRCEREQRERLQPRVAKRVRHQNVRRRRDRRERTAEQTAERHRQQQPRRRAPRASRDIHRDRKHDRGHRHGVDQRGEQPRCNHQRHDQLQLSAVREAANRPAQPVRDSRTGQRRRQDEHRPDRHDSRTAESGERLLRRHESGQRQRAEHQQRDQIHAQHAAHEQHQRPEKDPEDERDRGCHAVSAPAAQQTSRRGSAAPSDIAIPCACGCGRERRGVAARSRRNVRETMGAAHAPGKRRSGSRATVRNPGLRGLPICEPLATPAGKSKCLPAERTR
jgi:hypothetical protein